MLIGPGAPDLIPYVHHPTSTVITHHHHPPSIIHHPPSITIIHRHHPSPPSITIIIQHPSSPSSIVIQHRHHPSPPSIAIIIHRHHPSTPSIIQHPGKASDKGAAKDGQASALVEQEGPGPRHHSSVSSSSVVLSPPRPSRPGRTRTQNEAASSSVSSREDEDHDSSPLNWSPRTVPPGRNPNPRTVPPDTFSQLWSLRDWLTTTGAAGARPPATSRFRKNSAPTGARPRLLRGGAGNDGGRADPPASGISDPAAFFQLEEEELRSM